MKYLLGNAALAITLFMPVAVSAQLAGPIDNLSLSSGMMRAGLGSAVGSNIVSNDLGDEDVAIGAIASDPRGAAYGKSPSYYVAQNFASVNLPKTNSRKNQITPATRRTQYRKQTYYGGGARAYNYNTTKHHSVEQKPIHGQQALTPSYQKRQNMHIVTFPDPRTSYSTPHPVRIQKEIIRKDRIVIPSECPTGTILQSDGRCMEIPKTVYAPPPNIIPSACPTGTLDQGNGTCLELAKKVVKSSPKIITTQCPKGTTDQGNGTCLERARKVISQAPIVIPSTCPAGTIDKKNGTCLEPAKTIIRQTPIVIPANCPKGTIDKGNGTCIEPAKKIIKEMPVILPAKCPVGTTAQGAGICVKPAKTIVEAPPIIIPSSCPFDTITQGDGTCLEAPKAVIKQAPVILTAQCPIGTLDQGDGTCLEPKKIISQTSERITAKCPDGTTRQLNGICLSSEEAVEDIIEPHVSMPELSISEPSVPAYIPIVMSESDLSNAVAPNSSPSKNLHCKTDDKENYESETSDELAGGFDPLTQECKVQQH